MTDHSIKDKTVIIAGGAKNLGGLIARNLAPQSETESAIVITLPPGTYTAVVRGGGGSTGVGLVEVYDAGVPTL